ncbi:hypothetical protein AAG906_009583 [Vitis piasezkii]
MTTINSSCLYMSQRHSSVHEWHKYTINTAMMGYDRTTYSDILLYRKAIHLSLLKLDGPTFSWHNTNIGVVYGNQLRMSTPSRNQSSTMGNKDYFVWCEMMEKR